MLSHLKGNKMVTNSNPKWLAKIGFAFALISFAIYLLSYLLFHDIDFMSHHLMIDLAFLPIEVFLVATVFEKLMGRREEKARLERLHMITGAFFNEVGTDLVKTLAQNNSDAMITVKDYDLNETWSDADFARFKNNINQNVVKLQINATNLLELRDLLISRREYLLRLMENNNLMESEHFSQLLLAIYHLFEEIRLREDLQNLKPSDFAHLSEDVRRIYLLLTEQWINHLSHIKENTPYLFSLAVRTNPFNPEASVEVE